MSENATEAPAEPTESETPRPVELPADHPLVKTLAEQKKAIKELKSKAARLDEIEEANKSEAQRAAERIAALEREASEAKADALRFKIAAKFNVSDEDAELFLTGADEDTLTRQAERLVGRETERKKKGNVAPKEGASSPAAGDDMREFTRNLFGATD